MPTGRPTSLLRGVLLFLLGALVGANATYFVMTRNIPHPLRPPTTATAPSPSAEAMRVQQDGSMRGKTDAVRQPTGPLLPPPKPTLRGGAANAAGGLAASGGTLLIPVQGVVASQLSDTFNDARSADRVHDAIDIMAPAGTPVLAVADGRVEKFFTSKLGGLTLYQFNSDGTLAFYYAHLQRYADGLAEQQQIRRGQVIGYVGATGNASPDAPHLHFAIFELGPEQQWWQGVAVNPYPWLTGNAAAP